MSRLYDSGGLDEFAHLTCPVGYPTVMAANGTVTLVPTLDYPGPDSIAFPAPDFDRAAQLYAHFEKTPRMSGQDALGFPGQVAAAAWEYKAAPINGLASHYEALFKSREIAAEAARQAVKEFKANGHKLPKEALEELFNRRAEVQRTLQGFIPPIFRFEILRSEDTFDHVQDVVASRANVQAARQTLKRGHKQLNRLASDQNLQRYLEISKGRADYWKNVGRWVFAIEIAEPVMKMLMSDDEAELNKAAAELAKVGAGIAGGWAGSAFTATAAWTAKVTLGVVIAGTPAGWIVVGLGFMIGLGAGIYAGDVAKEHWLKTFSPPITLP